ncbi:MAG: hypothetical protein SVO26_01460 [Chloroflexota bacterium]|nr:hypothetical protein [Chloroflexota bacterium]
MKHRLLLIAITCALLLVAFPAGNVFADEPILEMEIDKDHFLIFDGDRAAVGVTLSNVGDEIAIDVTLISSTGERKLIGNIGVGGTVTSTFYIEKYEMGMNEVEIYSHYSSDFTDPWLIRFEVRPPDESITLRLVDAPLSIYEGDTFIAELEVQNLWQNAVSGASIKNGDEVLYLIGALQPDETQAIELRFDEYEIGTNTLQLVASHERGVAAPLALEFDVYPAENAVRAYFASSNSPVYLAETIEFSIVIAASEDADINQLELIALSNEVTPKGYYLGGQNAAEEPQVEGVEVADLGTLLTGGAAAPMGAQQPEEEAATFIEGSELHFIADKLAAGVHTFDFQLSYRIHNMVVQDEFSIEVEVLDIPSMKLIQAEPVTALEGEEVLITLHIANGLPVDVDSVSVIPVGNSYTAPSEFFIGEMAAGDFLPAYFRIASDHIEDGDELQFKVTYRVEQKAYETPIVSTIISIEEPPESNTGTYFTIFLVVVVVLILVWFFLRRRRRWTQSRSS